MSSKIYINEDIGYVEAWEALAHLTDDWICCGNVSHETVMNMRDVIAELRNELAEYVALHSKVADELGTANHKLMQIEDLAKRESGLTKRAPDAPKPFVNHCNPVNGVHAPFCNGDHSARG